MTGSVTSGRPPSQQDVVGGDAEALLLLLLAVIPLGEVDPLIPPPEEDVGDPRSYKKKI